MINEYIKTNLPLTLRECREDKYDVVKGSAEALAEYETPAMLGWTYGTYRVFSELLKEN